jgi:hypothetical protein
MQLGSARRLGVFASAALVLGLPLAGVCQSYDVDLVQSVRDAPVRSHPAANAETTFTAAKGTTLVWAAHMDSGGFYRVVRRGKGPVGWIDANDVRITHEHKHGGAQDDPDDKRRRARRRRAVIRCRQGRFGRPRPTASRRRPGQQAEFPRPGMRIVAVRHAKAARVPTT